MATVTSERDLAAALWRLAEEAETRGIRIMTEPISGEHFATSSREAHTLYRLTHYSCTCKGFFRWQRCTHHALFLAQLGWLPEVGDDPDPEPDPATPGAALRPETVVCMDCRGRGIEAFTAASGAVVELPCRSCAGTDGADSSPVISPDALPAPGEVIPAPDVEEMPSISIVEVTVDNVKIGDVGVVPEVTTRPSDLPDPWDTVPATVPAIPEAAPTLPTTVEVETVPAPIPFVRREDRARDLEATVEEAIASLAEQLARGHTVGYLEVLGFYSRFHRYSIPNTILIKSQRPEARLVAGLKRWNELGYRVRAGEKAVWVWAPMMKTETDEGSGERVERLVGFRPAPVFADSQLVIPEDKPLPSLFRSLPDDCEEQYRAAKGRVIASGIAVEEVSLPGGIQGASLGGKILLRSGLDSRNRLLILAHEVAHELAHQGQAGEEKPRAIRELEAESTAYVVGQVLGVENPFSADYLLNYGLDAPALQTALTTIQRLVRRVIAIVSPQVTEEVRRAA